MPHTLLIDSTTLAAHLADPAWVVVDARSHPVDPLVGRAGYASGHLRGAIFLDVDSDLCGTRTGRHGRHPLPDPDRLSTTLGAAGIAPHSQVVVYDDSGGASAARLWWLLRWLGHEAVAVLDGGLPRWLAEGRPLTTAVAARPQCRYEGRPRGDVMVDAAFVLGHLDTGDIVLVDARAPARYRGEAEPIDPVAGRIPGARNRPLTMNLGEHGGFKAPQALRAEFDAVLAGARPEQVIHYCGSGVGSCHNVLAMELAGSSGSRLYPGSWSEWIADPLRPVERG